jgi:signal peptidase I
MSAVDTHPAPLAVGVGIDAPGGIQRHTSGPQRPRPAAHRPAPRRRAIRDHDGLRRTGVFVRTVLSILSYGLVVAIVILVWPQRLGGPFGLVIVSGTSMLPALHDGDVVVLREKSSYDIDDIVVYRVTVSDGVYRIVHRVVAGEADGSMLTRGDNRPSVDPFRPNTQDVDGRVITVIPKVGQVMTAMADWRVSGGLAAITVFLALLLPSRREAEYAHDHPDFDPERNPGAGPDGGDPVPRGRHRNAAV